MTTTVYSKPFSENDPYALKEGTPSNYFKINNVSSNTSTYIDLFSQSDYPDTDEERSALGVQAYKQITMGTYARSKSYIQNNVDSDGVPIINIDHTIVDASGNSCAVVTNIEHDNTFQIIGDNDNYIKVTPISLTFNDGIDDIAVYNTTSINLRGGYVPVYHGESATEPATYQPGDEYWDTSSTGELKKFISYSVGWKSITTT